MHPFSSKNFPGRSPYHTQQTTPLHEACKHNQRETVISILSQTAIPYALANARDARGKSPLFYASSDPDTISPLLKAGAEVETLDTVLRTPFHSLARKSDFAAIQMLCNHLEEGNKNRFALVQPFLNPETSSIVIGYLEITAKIIKVILAEDYFLNSPVNYAISNHHEGMLKLFFDLGACPNIPDWNSCGPNPWYERLNLCKSTGRPQPVVIFKMLQDRAKQQRNERMQRTPLHVACTQNDRTEIVRLIGQMRFPTVALNQRDTSGQTPLFLAQYAPEDCITPLIEKGAKICLFDKDQQSPLFLQVKKESLKGIKILFAGIKTSILRKLMAAHTVFITDLASIVADYAVGDPILKLIYHQSLNKKREQQGDSPFTLAVKLSLVEIVRLFLEYGASPRRFFLNGQAGITRVYDVAGQVVAINKYAFSEKTASIELQRSKEIIQLFDEALEKEGGPKLSLRTNYPHPEFEMFSNHVKVILPLPKRKSYAGIQEEEWLE